MEIEETPEGTPTVGEERYIVARTYTLPDGVPYDEVLRLQPAFIELISQVPEFVAYYNFPVGENEFIGVSIFDSAEGAAEAGEATRQYVADNASHTVAGPPETIEGYAGIFDDSDEHTA